MLLYRKYEVAAANEQAAKDKLKEASDAVAELTRQVALAQNASLKASEALTPLRDADAAAAAKLNKLVLQKEQLSAEEDRLARAQKQLEDRKNQISSDMKREKSLEQEAAEAIEQLGAEIEKLTISAEDDAPKLAILSKDIEEKQTAIRELQGQLDTKTEELAASRAEHGSLAQQLASTEQDLQRLRSKEEGNRKELLVVQNSLDQLTKQDSVANELQTALAEHQAVTDELERVEQQKNNAELAERDARVQLQSVEKEVTTLNAEIRAIRAILQNDEVGEWTNVIEELKVQKGYEAALGAALGDELNAPCDPDAPTYWSNITTEQGASAFEGTTETLNQFVSGVKALELRLSQVAIIDASDAENIIKQLKQGQRAVTKEGALFRWDGYCQKADIKSAATVRLEQKNKLSELETKLSELEIAANVRKLALAECEKLIQKLRNEEKDLRLKRRAQETELTRLRAKQAEQQRENAAKTSRLQVLEEQAASLKDDINSTCAKLEELKQKRTSLSDLGSEQADIEKLRSELRHRREDLAAKRAEHDQIIRTSAIRNDRIKSATQERENWIRRSSGMADHFAQLEIRFSTTEEELKELENKPSELQRLRGELMDEIARAESARKSIRDQVSEAESVLAQCDAALRQAQEALATCREERVRHQADVEHTADVLKSLAGQIFEKLECQPENIKVAGGIEETEEIPPIDVSERKVERLKKERDGMGPVNLRAEIEAQEVDEQLSTLLEERADLEAAIARLRQGIASLNKEGRERLLEAFKKVDSHFQELFKQVFGGGYAHLKLTESEDPLAAGLEIMASPPGKRLQLMSLLSGGEQALTAVALLFAVFLTNPAPICVLDEVDAPLDDVNVERLCNLLDRLSKDSDTRFLVVTHHPITMARMDRLFGVTMAERGISQLVSVDLTRAQLMTDETV